MLVKYYQHEALYHFDFLQFTFVDYIIDLVMKCLTYIAQMSYIKFVATDHNALDYCRMFIKCVKQQTY